MSTTKHLALDYPYDWSNPQISDDALIAQVLKRGRFMDVSKVCAKFGLARLESTAQTMQLDTHAGVLGSVMDSIRLGEQAWSARP